MGISRRRYITTPGSLEEAAIKENIDLFVQNLKV